MSKLQPQAILVLPHLRVQNTNAISSPLTHGFPSITAFTGLMWALQRKLAQANIPLQLLSVGVVCHHHQEQAVAGDAQGERNAPLTQGIEQQQEEIVGLDAVGPVHRARLFSNKVARSITSAP